MVAVIKKQIAQIPMDHSNAIVNLASQGTESWHVTVSKIYSKHAKHQLDDLYIVLLILIEDYVRLKLFECSSIFPDVNECLIDNGGCHKKADCTNTDGSFKCDCQSGFTGDGVSTCNGKQDLF